MNSLKEIDQYLAGVESHKAWVWVRSSTRYDHVVSRANVWLPIFWRDAKAMGLSRVDRHNYAPKILIEDCDEITAGAWDGTNIIVPLPHQNLACISDEYPEPPRDYLRRTILHESQHALDTRNSLEKSSERHLRSFKKRLAKLELVFPPTQI